MKVAELIEILEDFDGDAEVRLAFQPRWPFEHSIGEVVETGGGSDSCSECGKVAGHDEDCEFDGEPEQDECVVYIAEGRQIGYLPGSASRELGWR